MKHCLVHSLAIPSTLDCVDNRTSEPQIAEFGDAVGCGMTTKTLSMAASIAGKLEVAARRAVRRF